MTQEKFRALQLVQAEIMDDIHRVCVKNNLKYYMIGGTALGAVRHKGFIPWDVDIDIAMPREDYERFIEIADDELDAKFECHSYKTDKVFFSPHILVVLKDSSITFCNDELNSQAIRFGIYVDILPLDQVPTDKRRRKSHARQLKFINVIKYYKDSRIYSKNGWFTRIMKRIIRGGLSVVSYYQLNVIQQKIATKYNSLPDTGEICSTLSHYKYEKLCMSKLIFGNPKLYDFEGRQYYGPESIEDYLTRIFGDYMKLPSLSVQEDLRNSIIDAEW